MGPLVALALVAQCGYAATYSYAAPTYSYSYAVPTYVPYVQAVKFVAVEPSYGDLYPSLVAGELRAARRYEVMEKQASALERLELALGRMASTAPPPEQYRPMYAASAPSGQYDTPPPPAKAPPPVYSAPQVPAKAPPVYGVPQVPAKAPPPVYSAPQVPAKAPPPAYSAPQVPAKAPPPAYSAPQVPAKMPPTYGVPQVPAKADSTYGDVASPPVLDLPEPTLAAAPDGSAVLGSRCASCHTRGALRGNSFPIFDGPGRLNPALTPAQVAEMVARVEAGDMPPTGPLPPGEVDAIRRFLTSPAATVASR